MPSPPNYVLECLRRAGKGFNEHLEALSWPDADRNAPAKEASLVLHIAHQMMQTNPPFHVYLEAATPDGGHLDLLAANDQIAIALEAKCFGDVGKQSDSLLHDVDRLWNFHPQYAMLNHKIDAIDWWKRVSSRWGIAVVASFCGSGEIAEAWKSGSSTRLEPEGSRLGFDRLLKGLGNAYREVVHISDGRHWNSCGSIDLLITAFEIQNEP